jgi:hypothetical protein
VVDSHSLWYVDRVLTRRFEWSLLVAVFALAVAVSSGWWPNAAVDAHIQHLIADLDAGGTARANATTELMRWGPSARAAVPALIAHHSEDLLALNALIRIGPGVATGALVQALEGKDKKAAAFAAQVLGFYGPAAAAAKPALLKAVSDPDLKDAAAEALRAVEGEEDFTQQLRRR